MTFGNPVIGSPARARASCDRERFRRRRRRRVHGPPPRPLLSPGRTAAARATVWRVYRERARSPCTSRAPLPSNDRGVLPRHGRGVVFTEDRVPCHGRATREPRTAQTRASVPLIDEPALFRGVARAPRRTYRFLFHFVCIQIFFV